MTARQTRKDHARTKADTADPASETLDADYRAFHKTAKRLPERKRQAIEAKFQAAFARERQEDLRCLNSRFMFWSVCPEKACKRTSRCMGEPDACFERWWPAIPEGVKVQFRAFITASAKGLSNEEAARESEAARQITDSGKV